MQERLITMKIGVVVEIVGITWIEEPKVIGLYTVHGMRNFIETLVLVRKMFVIIGSISDQYFQYMSGNPRHNTH